MSAAMRVLAPQLTDIPVSAEPKPGCVCCWYVAHAKSGDVFPAKATSSLCAPHATWTVQQRRARRADKDDKE